MRCLANAATDQPMVFSDEHFSRGDRAKRNRRLREPVLRRLALVNSSGHAVFAAEAINPAGSVHDFLLAGVERV